MKKSIKFILAFATLSIIGITYTSCSDDDGDMTPSNTNNTNNNNTNNNNNNNTNNEDPVDSVEVTVSFDQLVNGNNLQLNVFPFPYQNAKGQMFNISNLKYLVTDISFRSSRRKLYHIRKVSLG